MTDYEPARDGDDSEVDLMDVYARVRPSLLPALIIGILSAIAMFFYAKNLEKTYSATAKFVISEGGKSSLSDFGGLVANFIPSGGGSGESLLVSDKIMSRDFILDLFPQTGIDNDPFFNGANSRPSLRSWVFGKNPSTPEAITERIVKKYRKSVKVDNFDDNGVISLHVKHSDPVEASRLANTIMDTHIRNIDEKRIAADQRQVDLMRKRLLIARTDLDEALQAARVYAVENSVRSKEELGASSLNLTRFRKELERLQAIQKGIDYIEEQRAAEPEGSLKLSDFFAKHPLAFTPLQNDLGWSNNRGTIPFPSATQLAGLKQPLLDELGQLQRTLSVMENEAARNSEAAGRLAELERDIQVQKSIYTALVGQFEARALSADLQDKNVERIQTATPPLAPSSPRVLRIALLGLLLGAFAVLALGLIRSWRSGKIYLARHIERLFQQSVMVSDIGQSVGTRPLPINKLMQQSQQRNNPELLDLALSLRDEGARSLCVLGVPNLLVARNLAIVLGSSLVKDGKRVAVVDLARRNANAKASVFQETGTLAKGEEDADVSIFRWVNNSEETALSLDDALLQLETDFDHTVIICASLKWGGLRNKIAMSRADHIILLAQKSMTTKRDTAAVNKIISGAGEARTTLTLV